MKFLNFPGFQHFSIWLTQCFTLSTDRNILLQVSQRFFMLKQPKFLADFQFKYQIEEITSLTYICTGGGFWGEV